MLKGAEAVRRFVDDSIFPLVISSSCPKTLNLQVAFAEFLINNGFPRSLADENSEKWLFNLEKTLYWRLENWKKLGVPLPLGFPSSGKTVLTWKHDKYLDQIGAPPLSQEFVEICEWISSRNGSSFLLVCVCWLYLLGADPIYITDQAGDGGVDVIGKVSSGPHHSTCYFVQAKTCRKLIDPDQILIEYGKYMVSQNTDKISKYLKVLGADKSRDGASLVYLFLANNQFKDSAQKNATSLGVLLRSKYQLSHWLSIKFGKSKLEEIEKAFNGNFQADYSRNLASVIKKASKTKTIQGN